MLRARTTAHRPEANACHTNMFGLRTTTRPSLRRKRSQCASTHCSSLTAHRRATGTHTKSTTSTLLWMVAALPNMCVVRRLTSLNMPNSKRACTSTHTRARCWAGIRDMSEHTQARSSLPSAGSNSRKLKFPFWRDRPGSAASGTPAPSTRPPSERSGARRGAGRATLRLSRACSQHRTEDQELTQGRDGAWAVRGLVPCGQRAYRRAYHPRP